MREQRAWNALSALVGVACAAPAVLVLWDRWHAAHPERVPVVRDSLPPCPRDGARDIFDSTR